MAVDEQTNSHASSLREELQKLQSRYRDDLSKDEALALLIETADLHMKLLKIATSPSEKADLKKTTKSLIEEAEQLKKSPAGRSGPLRSIDAITPLSSPLSKAKSSSPAAASPASVPQSAHESPAKPVTATFQWHESAREPTRSEKIILLQGSQFNKAKFPPWGQGPLVEDTLLSSGHNLFKDPFVYSFSDDQQQIFDDWHRPVDALPPPRWPSTLTPASTQVLMKIPANENIDLVQDAATDCSVVASLCVCVARAESGHPKILRNNFFPYDDVNDCPAISPNGKYYVKLQFNGCARRVMVDDRLPVSKTKHILHVVDRNHPSLLWPALVEKAYLKVRGGYDFPGSNSGTDLWVLTGWIPEQVFVEDPDVDRDDLWNRIYQAFLRGNVLVTLGTSDLPEEQQDEMGLAGEHDYAVLDLQQDKGKRKLLIKNPWARATARRAYHRKLDDLIEEDEEDEDETGGGSSALRVSSTASYSDNNLPPGQFWMDLDSVMNDFASIYLNWNPALFPHRQDLHFKWDLGDNVRRSAVGSFGSNPQYTIFSGRGGIAWVLLSRHFQDKTVQDEKLIAIDPESDKEKDGYISLYAYRDRKIRVLLAKGALERGPYVDSPQTLLRLDLDPRTFYTIVVSEQQLHSVKHNFTLSTFSYNPITIDPTPDRFKKRQTITGSWTTASAGGNAGSPTYSSNPQFALTIPTDAQLCLVLETLDPSLNIHVKLMHGHGKRVYAATSRDIVVDSKDYRKGCALAESTAPIIAGTYTVVVSTFEAGQLGSFSVTAMADVDMTMKEIPREGAGRIVTELTPASFAKGVRCVAAPLRMLRLAKVALLANHIDTALSSNSLNAASASASAPRSPIRLTIERGRGPDRFIAIASAGGSYSDAASGVRTDDVNLGPQDSKADDLWLVIERLGGFGGTGRVEERVAVRVFVDTIDAFVCGVWREVERSV